MFRKNKKGQLSLDLIIAITAALVFLGMFSVLQTEVLDSNEQVLIKNQLKDIGLNVRNIASLGQSFYNDGTYKTNIDSVDTISYEIPKVKSAKFAGANYDVDIKYINSDNTLELTAKADPEDIKIEIPMPKAYKWAGGACSSTQTLELSNNKFRCN